MNNPPSDELLHGYVDDALADEERHAVEAWIAQDPEVAQRVRAYREQNAALHALFDPVLHEPHALDLRPVPPRARHGAHWLALAATLVLGVPIGTVMSRRSRARERRRLLLETGGAPAERPAPLRRIK